MEEVLTTKQAAEELGLSPKTVRALAQRRGLGRNLTPRVKVFTRAEVESMKLRRPSGPRAS